MEQVSEAEIASEAISCITLSEIYITGIALSYFSNYLSCKGWLPINSARK